LISKGVSWNCHQQVTFVAQTADSCTFSDVL